MQVTMNTINYQQTPLRNNKKSNYTANNSTPSFGGSNSVFNAFTSKSTFFEPLEKGWDVMTDWIAKNIIAKAMNTDFVARFAEKTKDSKYIANHIITAGAAVGTATYVKKTLSLPEEKMESDRKKVLAANHILTFGVSTAGAYLVDGALFNKWRKVTNRYAELYTKDNDLMKKIDGINKELKSQGKNKIDVIDYANDYLSDKKLVARLKGMDIAKTLLICTLIYRYLVPVAVTPIANKLGDKFLAHRKEREAELEKA